MNKLVPFRSADFAPALIMAAGDQTRRRVKAKNWPKIARAPPRPRPRWTLHNSANRSASFHPGSCSIRNLRRDHSMHNLESLPLDRAQMRREQLERELRKCPDFQLYLITKAPHDRIRMEHVLMENPRFRLWRVLTNSIESCTEPSSRNVETGHANCSLFIPVNTIPTDATYSDS
jgi:hypothetical protein